MYDFLMLTVQPLFEAIIPVLVAMAMAFVTYYAKKKLGIEVQKDLTANLEKMAVNAIYRVEEQSMREIATGMDKKVVGWKHGAAVDKLLGMAPDLSKAEATELVKNLVARLPDIGAFKVPLR